MTTAEPNGPPEPQLLDTSVVQALDWVDALREAETPFQWTDERMAELEALYGRRHANELLDLGTLYTRFESGDGYPWLVSQAALLEIDRLRDRKGYRLRHMFDFLAGHQDDWHCDAYPGVALGTLRPSRPWSPSRLVLRGLGVEHVDDIVADTGPLGFLPDEGDRRLVRDALLANVPAILTLDRRTLWSRRDGLRSLGIDVFQPSELLGMYRTHWAQDAMLRQRQRCR
jgi:hypothetical protein